MDYLDELIELAKWDCSHDFLVMGEMDGSGD